MAACILSERKVVISIVTAFNESYLEVPRASGVSVWEEDTCKNVQYC